MFLSSAVVARQQKMKHVFMEMLESPTVLSTFREATVAWLLLYGNQQ